MKSFHIVTLIACIGALPFLSARAQEEKWSIRTLADSHDGVTLDYQRKKYRDKETGLKTMVKWVVRNNNDYPVDVEMLRSYRSTVAPGTDENSSRKGSISGLRPGNVWDDSPDFVPGDVFQISGSLRVRRTGDPKASRTTKAAPTATTASTSTPNARSTPPHPEPSVSKFASPPASWDTRPRSDGNDKDKVAESTSSAQQRTESDLDHLTGTYSGQYLLWANGLPDAKPIKTDIEVFLERGTLAWKGGSTVEPIILRRTAPGEYAYSFPVTSKGPAQGTTVNGTMTFGDASMTRAETGYVQFNGKTIQWIGGGKLRKIR